MVLLATVSYPGADLVGLATRWAQPPRAAVVAQTGVLSWLHVEHPRGGTPFIADASGRRVELRGTVAAGLVDYWSGSSDVQSEPPPFFPIDPSAYTTGCPTNFLTIRVPPLCQDDLAEMHALGFNVVRLALSWSLLEPQPGSYSAQYLDRIAQVVGWAREQGIYVILDMHENAYSRYIPRPSRLVEPGASFPSLFDQTGAPKWATVTDNLPGDKLLGQREVSLSVGAAFTNFWFDTKVHGKGLQEWYIGAVAALARRFGSDSTVAGYGVFNEPWPGFVIPPTADDLLIYPFYRRLIDALTGAHDGLRCSSALPLFPICGHPDLGIGAARQIFFLEADHVRELTDLPTTLDLPISSYPNLAFSIHPYTHKYTVDALAGLKPDHSPYPIGGYQQSYATGQAEARSLGGALFVSEFGNEPELDASLLTNELKQQDAYATGSTYWPWKENCGGSTWGVYNGPLGNTKNAFCAHQQPAGKIPLGPQAQNGCLRQSKERLLARPTLNAIPGGSLRYSYDPATGSFSLTAVAPAGNQLAALVTIPREIAGATSRPATARPDGSRTVTFTPLGSYSLKIAPAPLRLTGC
ncbi:MAG: glycoside hydrolase family 5 protein [Chloroflexi bacterium]|nr:MAG: glycoside hydrolase family 5 protein [Chloroflexota bacterium]